MLTNHFKIKTKAIIAAVLLFNTTGTVVPPLHAHARCYWHICVMSRLYQYNVIMLIP